MQHRNLETEPDNDNETEPEPQADEAAPLLSESEKKSPKSQDSTDDPRFNPSPPSPWKRLALLLVLAFSFWAAFKLRTALVLAKKPKVVHASRYSKEFKFRPAASPIITETLKDGRTRLRGALAEPTSTLLPSITPKKHKKKKGAVSGKRKKSKVKKPAKK